MGKAEKTREEYHATKVTKIPKTKTRKYGMNETIKCKKNYLGLFLFRFHSQPHKIELVLEDLHSNLWLSLEFLGKEIDLSSISF